MGRNSSIAISVKDNATSQLKTIKKSASELTKEMQSLGTQIKNINKAKATVQVKVDKAKQELKEAKKAFNDTQEAAERLEAAQLNYNHLSNSLKNINSAAKDAQKSLKGLGTEYSRLDNRVEKSPIGTSGEGSSGVFAILGASGATRLVGDTLSNVVSSYVGSAYGDAGASALGSILSGVTSGAAVGTMIAPGIGTAIGAAAGSVVGIINNAVNQFERTNDAFKSKVQDLYSQALESQAAALESGIGIAGSRETALVSFTTLFGDRDDAEAFLADIQEMAKTTPFLYDDLTGMAKVLKSFGYAKDDLIPLMTKIGDAGAALGMSTSDMETLAQQLGRMKVSNKTTQEYLLPMLERGIDVYGYLATAMGKTKEEAMEMVSDGLVPGAEAANVIANLMGRDYSGSMEHQAETYEGLASTLEGMQQELQNAMGEGYNAAKKSGLASQIDWLGGESVSRLQEGYALIGQGQAEAEGLYQEIYQRVMDSLLSSSAYNEALDRGDWMNLRSMIAEAETKAQAQYEASPEYQALQESNIDLMESIRENVAANEESYLIEKELSDNMSLGIKSVDALKSSLDNASTKLDTSSVYLRGTNPKWLQDGTSHYNGLAEVPYDGYVAKLHKGEAVVPARYNTGGSVTVTGNSFIVREEVDIDKIARALAREIDYARLVAY